MWYRNTVLPCVILCLVCTTDCPVFEVKAKINFSVPSDVINRSKPIDFTIECMNKTDSHIILNRILKSPAQPSHILGTMEKFNIFTLDQEVQVLNKEIKLFEG